MALSLPTTLFLSLCTCILHRVVRFDVVLSIPFLDPMAALALAFRFRPSNVSLIPFAWDYSPSLARGELRNARSANALALGWVHFEALGGVPVPTPRPE
jgi:hypothetical protein